jgi:hypothetical protein
VTDDERVKYLGDAVYASFDGYQIWLETRDRQRMRIALEPNVYTALVRYACMVWHPALTRDAVEK